jgi:serine/threonine-protein kinase
MPLVSGGDLKERLSEFVVGPKGGHTSWCEADLTAKVAGAVAFLHRRGILHRDLKPSNILLASASGREPLVCDFGLAGRLDETSPSFGMVGTPAYMAPEQREAGPLTPAADIWSLGAILYELLTGRSPFSSPSSGDSDLLPPGELNAGVDADLEQICMHCLRRDVSMRYATAEELAADLRCYLNRTPEQEQVNQ